MRTICQNGVRVPQERGLIEERNFRQLEFLLNRMSEQVVHLFGLLQVHHSITTVVSRAN